MNLRRKLKPLYCRIKNWYYNKRYGMHLSLSARLSRGVEVDTTYPQGVYIDDDTFVVGGVIIFTHDYCRGLHLDTKIGKRCFLGARCVIMAGVTVGDEVVVGTGAIVTRDVPSGCIVAGNPARIIRTDIHTAPLGKIICNGTKIK